MVSVLKETCSKELMCFGNQFDFKQNTRAGRCIHLRFLENPVVIFKFCRDCSCFVLIMTKKAALKNGRCRFLSSHRNEFSGTIDSPIFLVNGNSCWIDSDSHPLHSIEQLHPKLFLTADRMQKWKKVGTIQYCQRMSIFSVAQVIFVHLRTKTSWGNKGILKNIVLYQIVLSKSHPIKVNT